MQERIMNKSVNQSKEVHTKRNTHTHLTLMRCHSHRNNPIICRRLIILKYMDMKKRLIEPNIMV
uniref:Uncharacterized protein n=1 Tax=Rhizophora mucronata TaxID=61149 RepID=A0A2P2P4J7_RHIMU